MSRLSQRFLQWFFIFGLLALVLTCFALAGCATSGQRGDQLFLYRNKAGREVLSLTAPPDSDPRGTPLPTARITNNPTDEEFWQFEMKVKVRWYGAPVGSYPRDVQVIGPRYQCEMVRENFKYAVTDQTKPCEGPFYFRRDKS